jgi:hypothetical protein
VEVEGEGVGVKLHDDVINKFKYIKQKTVQFGPIFKRDKKDKVMMNAKGGTIKLKRSEKVLPAQWYGYSKQSRKRITLNTQWVEDNFDKRFLSQIKNTCLSRNRKRRKNFVWQMHLHFTHSWHCVQPKKQESTTHVFDVSLTMWFTDDWRIGEQEFSSLLGFLCLPAW